MSESKARGIHHITTLASDARRNVAFYTQGSLRQRAGRERVHPTAQGAEDRVLPVNAGWHPTGAAPAAPAHGGAEPEREADDDLMDRNFTIPPADRRIAASGVARVLAATGVLWMKTQGFAWNAQGREGMGLTGILGAQAKDLRRALAPLAGRIRALGFYAPASLADLIALAPIEEDPGVPVAGEMARRLQTDHDAATALIRCIRPALEDIEDTATCFVLDARLAAHESAAATLVAFRRACPPDGLLAASVRDDLVLSEPPSDDDGGNGNGSPN